MDTRSLFFAILVVVFFLVNYSILRDLMYGILLGSRSKKAALKIKSEQSFFARFTMRYIKDHLVKYQDAFHAWQTVTLVHLLLTLASIVAFVLMIVLKVPFWIVLIVCGVLTVYNVVLFMIMMSKTATSNLKKTRKGSPWKYEQ